MHCVIRLHAEHGIQQNDASENENKIQHEKEKEIKIDVVKWFIPESYSQGAK